MINQKVSIIVLNYNGLDFLKKCLSTVKAQTYADIETIVVDNNSSDASCEYVRQLRWVKLVVNKENFGFSKANNIGVKEAKGEFLLFLNNDTELFPDAIEKMVSCWKGKTIVAPAQIVFSNRENDAAGFPGNGMDILGNAFGKEEPEKRKIFYVEGSALFIRREDFFAIGMFDEALFIFQEDVDLCWRAQIMGYNIIQCWQAKYYHHTGGFVLGGAIKEKQYQTSYFRRYLNEKNVIRNILKNYSFPLCVIILWALLSVHLLEIALFALLLKGKVIKCYSRAYAWNITNLKDTLSFRKSVQARRKVSDLALMRRMHLDYSKLHSFIKIGVPQFA